CRRNGRSRQNSISNGVTRKPPQWGGRGTLASAYCAAVLAISFSKAQRPCIGRDWADAQQPIWLSLGRVAKYASDSAALVLATWPRMRTCLPRLFQWKHSAAKG